MGGMRRKATGICFLLCRESQQHAEKSREKIDQPSGRQVHVTVTGKTSCGPGFCHLQPKALTHIHGYQVTIQYKMNSTVECIDYI